MSMYANVSLVKWIYPGQSVSYGRHFVAEKPTKVATMSIGYAVVYHVFYRIRDLSVSTWPKM